MQTLEAFMKEAARKRRLYVHRRRKWLASHPNVTVAQIVTVELSIEELKRAPKS